MIEPFLGDGVMLGLDDTLVRKRGLRMFGTGMHHDPLSSPASGGSVVRRPARACAGHERQAAEAGRDGGPVPSQRQPVTSKSFAELPLTVPSSGIPI